MEVDFRRESGEEVALTWKQKARQHLKPDPKDKKRPSEPQLYRLASYSWLCALDNQLRVCLGTGLVSFISAKTPKAALPSLPEGVAGESTGKQLNISIDQGSDGWCPAIYLVHGLFLRAVLFFDPSHRVWNDCQGAIKQQGLWDTILLWGILFNLNDGPYEGAAWWRTTQEAAESYAATAKTDCPILQNLLPRIAMETGQEERMTDPTWPQEVLDNLFAARAVDSKGPSMSTSRWFSWMHCFEYWQGSNALRLLLWTYLGIHLGYLKEAASGKPKVQVPKKDEDAAKTTTKKGKKESEVQDLRNRTKTPCTLPQ